MNGLITPAICRYAKQQARPIGRMSTKAYQDPIGRTTIFEHHASFGKDFSRIRADRHFPESVEGNVSWRLTQLLMPSQLCMS